MHVLEDYKDYLTEDNPMHWHWALEPVMYHKPMDLCCHCLNLFCLWCVVPQGRTYSSENKGGPDPGGVSLFWQYQVWHLRNWRVPAVRSGFWLGAVVSIPQPTKVLVDTTQPHCPYQVNTMWAIQLCFELSKRDNNLKIMKEKERNEMKMKERNLLHSFISLKKCHHERS